MALQVAPSRSCPNLFKPSGTAIRAAKAQEKRLFLGVYPAVYLKVACRRPGIKGMLRGCIDPGEEPKMAKAEAADEGVAREQAFEAVARSWGDKKRSWTPRQGTQVMEKLESPVAQNSTGQPIAQLGAPDLLPFLQKTERRGCLEMAHRCRCSAAW